MSSLDIVGPLFELEARAVILDLHLQPGASVSIATPVSESVIGYLYELASAMFGYREELLQRVQAFHFKGGHGGRTADVPRPY